MAASRRLRLNDSELATLQALYDQAPRNYLRDRAHALLRIAKGEAPTAVAQTCRSGPRTPRTIYSWLARYRADGIDGLRIRPGRGRKPLPTP